VPVDLVPELMDQINLVAEEQKMTFRTNLKPLAHDQFIRIQLPSGDEMVHVNNDGRLNIQFMREALARVFNTPERIDWKKCVKSDKEESDDAEKFRKAFEKFELDIQE
jgi:hypothetical protein